MLESINRAEESFTGERYNILRVIAAYPLGASLDSDSPEVQKELEEDSHPLATLDQALLLSSLTPSDSVPSILSSLSLTLKRLRDDDKGDGQPSSKLRKIGR
jgi:hypothetical protein